MSSYNNQPLTNCTELGYCDALVVGIADVNGINNPSFKITPVGTTQALLDDVNIAGARIQVQQDKAVRRVRIKRIPRGTAADAVDSLSCDVTFTNDYTEDYFEVQEKISTAWETSKNELQRFCDDALQVVNTGTNMNASETYFTIMERVNTSMNALRERINQRVIAKVLANMGNNISYDTSVPQNLPMIDAVNGHKIEKGIQQLRYDLTNNEVYGMPLVSGFGVFDKFNTSAQYGCCNQYGLDWNGMMTGAPYKYYTDVQLGGIQGNNDFFLVFAPGDVQFVTYNDNVVNGINGGRHGTTFYGTIPDPLLPGIVYDLAIEEGNCRNGERYPTWTISLYLNWDLYTLPSSAYKVGDRLRTANGHVNGIFNYIAQAI